MPDDDPIGGGKNSPIYKKGEELVSGSSEFTLEDAQALWDEIMVNGVYDESEQSAVAELQKDYTWTQEALDWFDKQVSEL